MIIKDNNKQNHYGEISGLSTTNEILIRFEIHPDGGCSWGLKDLIHIFMDFGSRLARWGFNSEDYDRHCHYGHYCFSL